MSYSHDQVVSKTIKVTPKTLNSKICRPELTIKPVCMFGNPPNVAVRGRGSFPLVHPVNLGQRPLN
jgi:hypothetical protein